MLMVCNNPEKGQQVTERDIWGERREKGGRRRAVKIYANFVLGLRPVKTDVYRLSLIPPSLNTRTINRDRTDRSRSIVHR